MDCKEFDLLRQGGVKDILAVYDKFAAMLKKDDWFYVKKSRGGEEVIKVRLVDKKKYESFLDVYYNGENSLKNEALLDYLMRVYDFYDEEDEIAYGVVRLTVSQSE